MNSSIYSQWEQWEAQIQTWLNQSNNDLELSNTTPFDRVILTILTIKYHVLYEDLTTDKNDNRLATIQLSKTKLMNVEIEKERHRDREKLFDNFTGRFLSPEEAAIETSFEWNEFNQLCDWHGLAFVQRFERCLPRFIQELIANTSAYEELRKNPRLKSSTTPIAQQVYQKKYENEIFLSIDMKSANFSILQHMHAIDPTIYPTWPDFLSTFVGSKSVFIHSKKLRMKCLGKLPEYYRLEALWTDYTAKIYQNTLLRCFDQKEIDVRCMTLCGDEIVFHLSSSMKVEKIIEFVDYIRQQLIKDSLIIKFTVQAYRLKSFSWQKTHTCFARHFIGQNEKEFDLKCVPFKDKNYAQAFTDYQQLQDSSFSLK